MALPISAEQFYAAKLAFETDSADVQAMQAEGVDIVLVDARAPAAFAHETLPGAINFPHRDMSPACLAALAREPLYICFCDGIGCNASIKGALKLAAAGFAVKALMGGMDWWKRDGYPTVPGGELAAPQRTAVGCHC